MIKSGRFYEQLRSAGLSRSEAVDIISFITGESYQNILFDPYSYDIPRHAAEEALDMLAKDIPVAYITGRKEFYGYEFKVTKDTLIPRPDTETLVDAVLRDFSAEQHLMIMDFYTGSGCILLSLLKELPNATGTGIDISESALKVAQENSIRFGMSGRCSFVRHDLLVGFPLYGDISSQVPLIITANPPYISRDDYESSVPSLFYEPELALVAEDDGYIHYKKLLNTLAKMSNNNVHFYLEVGFSQANTVRECAAGLGLKTEAIKDLAGIERVVTGTQTGFASRV